jgi:serine/threonine protein kinase/tetratricopeptide (TPR) repeat protein
VTTELREQLQDTLGKGYIVERELSGAGMSRVFVAHDTALGRRIVVKILPRELAAGVSLTRFRREMQHAASLVHPHIIALLGQGEADGLPYYTMPFVEGESLRTKLAREGRLIVDEALRLAREVAKALDYAHRQGLVHRDIKPENILLQDGHALVTDFGIARAIARSSDSSSGNLTAMGIAIGTPRYMSPEQSYGDRDIDGRSDLYALGCVLYEMLVGQPPFDGKSDRAILISHGSDPVPRPSTKRQELSIAIDNVVLGALAKEPDDRYATGAEFAGFLDQVLSGGDGPRTSARAVVHAERVVAVLPFENMSADPENEYFSDGVTEEIISGLAKIRGLRVISRSSVSQYKKTRLGVREIASALGATHVLEGSVRRAGNRVRITAQLIDGRSDAHVWAEKYDFDITDIFAIQSQVAVQIADRMEAKITTGERARLGKKPTEDLEAYNLYLLGRHHYNKITPADFVRALEYYRAAIGRDAGFARAHAALAEALTYLGLGYWGMRPHDMWSEAFGHATRALELDPTVAEAHQTIGMYYWWYQYDWERGGASVARAVELNPSSPFPRLVWAMHLAGIGRFDEAIVERDIACQLDPSAMSIRGNASWVTYLCRRMDDAVAEARRIRLIDATSSYGAFSHGLVCAQAGYADEAIVAFEDAVRLSERSTSLYLVTLAYGLAVGGRAVDARAVLAEVNERAKTEFVWPMGLAFVYAHLGETETALDHLERAYQERVGWMALIGREPALDILREHPRFREIARRIGPPGAS